MDRKCMPRKPTLKLDVDDPFARGRVRSCLWQSLYGVP
jgi:hypothetical protein